jgi:hypothetical protein
MGKLKYVFWSGVGVVLVSFGLSLYTAVLDAEKKEARYAPPTDQTGIAVPAQ